MKNSVIAIQSFVITTIVYALLVPVFLEMDNAFGEEKNFVDDSNDNTTSSEQEVENYDKVMESHTNRLTIFYNRALVYKQRLKKIYLTKIKGHS